MGVISAIGDTVAANRSALVAGQCGITPLTYLHSRYAGLLSAGEIGTATRELKEKLQACDPGITRTTLLALHAFNEAIADAALTAGQIGASDTALAGATTVGGMCLTDELYRDATGISGGLTAPVASPFLSSYDYASVILYLQARYKMDGLVTTINTACSSSANAIMYGARLIRNGLARRAIVGGADSLAKFTINGFNALQILSPGICQPFDENRKGLNLGEGAAFLVLERGEDLGFEDDPGKTKPVNKHDPGGKAVKRIYAELTGYCNANDAFHPSSLSPEGDGPHAAMEGALRSAGLDKSRIGFINAHGTGTENNDAAESRAMIRLFGAPPAFASTKSNTGHTLGASGAIEAVYSISALFHQEVYAALNFKEPIRTTGLTPVTAYRQTHLEHVMSNSFGFGGNCSSLIFSKAN
jgi:3-oxoacyl-(acyl-carrier-protein) synthase